MPFTRDCQVKISLIAFHDRIDQFEFPFTIKYAWFERIFFYKGNEIYDSSHIIWRNHFFYSGIFEKKCQRLIRIGISLDLIDHGKMCRNKIPEAGAGIFINKNHVLDVEYLICNPVDHITIRFVFFIVIDCRHNIIRIPKPVFVPCQIITKNCPMCAHGITFIGFFQLIALSLYTTHISRNLTVLRKLIILNFIRDLV